MLTPCSRSDIFLHLPKHRREHNRQLGSVLGKDSGLSEGASELGNPVESESPPERGGHPLESLGRNTLGVRRESVNIRITSAGDR